MPWRDWQFWVVTLIALAAGTIAVRSFWPKKRTGKKTQLTIGGERRR